MSEPKTVTIVYDIVDETAFRDGGNPLRYEHHGLKAHTVAAYDAVELCHSFRESLQAIADLNTGFSSDSDTMQRYAKQALRDALNAPRRTRRTIRHQTCPSPGV